MDTKNHAFEKYIRVQDVIWGTGWKLSVVSFSKAFDSKQSPDFTNLTWKGWSALDSFSHTQTRVCSKMKIRIRFRAGRNRNGFWSIEEFSSDKLLPRKLTCTPEKRRILKLLSFWNGPFSVDMFVLGGYILVWVLPKQSKSGYWRLITFPACKWRDDSPTVTGFWQAPSNSVQKNVNFENPIQAVCLSHPSCVLLSIVSSEVSF